MPDAPLTPEGMGDKHYQIEDLLQEHSLLLATCQYAWRLTHGMDEQVALRHVLHMALNMVMGRQRFKAWCATWEGE